jgi:GR25 family glycosyltransferase involved in LPS biosynthesis
MDNIVEHIYVINMKKNTKRLNTFKKQVNNCFDYEIIEGVDVTSSKYINLYNNWKIENNFDICYDNFNWKFYINYYEDLQKANINTKQSAWNHWNNYGKNELRSCNPLCSIINNGQLGCLLSHINILKDAIKNGYKSILILEDDIVITSKYNNNSLQLLKKYMKCNLWKIIYLGGGQHCWDNIDFFENYYYAKQTTGTFAYIVHHSFYQILLDEFEKMKKPVDNYLVDIQKKKYEKIIVLFPNIIICNLEESDIGEYRNNNELYKKFKWIL